MNGREGNDDLYLQDHADQARGGPGEDKILGGGGPDDDMRGGLGDDFISGGLRWDGISGGMGDDILKGGPDGDYLLGWWGSDTIIGGEGDDEIEPNPRLGYPQETRDTEDKVYAGPGDDHIRMEYEDSTTDYIDCGDGRDVVYGYIDDGEDTLVNCEVLLQ